MSASASVNNARVCTFDGRDYFVASFRVNGQMVVEGHNTADEAFAWLKAETMRRGLQLDAIFFRAGDPGSPITTVKP